jgi:hypothetical protein
MKLGSRSSHPHRRNQRSITTGMARMNRVVRMKASGLFHGTCSKFIPKNPVTAVNGRKIVAMMVS